MSNYHIWSIYLVTWMTVTSILHEKRKRVGWWYSNKAIYKFRGYYSQCSLCKQCLVDMCNAVILGIFIQDRNAKPTSKVAFQFLSPWNVFKDAVARYRHVWDESVIGEVAACIFIIFYFYLNGIQTYSCDVMRCDVISLPTKIVTLTEVKVKVTGPTTSVSNVHAAQSFK